MKRSALIIAAAMATGPAVAQQSVLDAYNAPFAGETSMTVGQVYASAGRALKIRCTAGGVVTFSYADGSSGQWDAVVGSQTIPNAVTSVTSSTGTCTFSNLK